MSTPDQREATLDFNLDLHPSLEVLKWMAGERGDRITITFSSLFHSRSGSMKPIPEVVVDEAAYQMGQELGIAFRLDGITWRRGRRVIEVAFVRELAT